MTTILKQFSSAVVTRGCMLLSAALMTQCTAQFVAHMTCATCEAQDKNTIPLHDNQPLAKLDEHGDKLPLGAKLRFGTVRLRTEQGAMSIAFSPDGKHLISTDWSHRVRIWDVGTGRESGSLDLGGHVDAAVVTSDGNYLIVNRLSGLSLRKLPEGETLFSNSDWQGNNRNFALSKDGSILASFPLQDNQKLWDTATGTEVLEFKSEDKLTNGCFSPSGQFMAVCSSRTKLKVWDLYVGKITTELTPKNKTRWENVLFIDDNTVVGYGNRSKLVDGQSVSVANIEMWHLDNPTESKLFETKLGDIPGGRSMAISPDHSVLATSHPNQLVVWNIATREPMRVLESDNKFDYRGIAISPDNHRLATGGSDHKLMIWNLETGDQEHPQQDSHHGGVLSMALSPGDGKLVSTGEEGSTRLWDLSTGTHLALLHRNAGWTRDVKFFSDGSQVAVCGEFYDPKIASGYRGKAAIVKVPTGEVLHEWILSARAMKLALNKQGRLAAISVGMGMPFGDEPPPEIQLWDLEKYEIIASLKQVQGEISKIDFEADDLIRFTTASGIFVWDTNESTPKQSRSALPLAQGNSQVSELVLSSTDGERIVVASSVYDRTSMKSTGSMRLVKTASHEEIWAKSFPEHVVRAAALTNDGRTLAVFLQTSFGGNDPSRLEFMNLNNGESLLSYVLPGLRVRSIVFSVDGNTLFTGMDQGDILRWDVRSAIVNAKEAN